MLTLKYLSIGKFMKEYYIPALENYLYHMFYDCVLSKNICGEMKSEGCFSVTGDILFVRDYTEHLSARFDLEI